MFVYVLNAVHNTPQAGCISPLYAREKWVNGFAAVFSSRVTLTSTQPTGLNPDALPKVTLDFVDEFDRYPISSSKMYSK